MTISVILCTYNRSKSLAQALSSLAGQALHPSIEWEVLVVDNNSKDETRAVVGEFCSLYPDRFRYLFEPASGKSFALNTGIREARGAILAFLDDDVIADPAWLQNLTANLRRDDWAGAGGRILPPSTLSLPNWLSSDFPNSMDPLAMFDRGPHPGPLAESPYGANMAFRKEVFERHGGFRTDLGPRPGSMIRGEDTEFGKRMLAAGERLRYEPAAVVVHAVPESRLRKEYFLAWWFDKGRADIREFGVPSDTILYLFGVPLYMYRRLFMWTLRWLFAFEPGQRFYGRRLVWSLAGSILELFQKWKGRGTDLP